MLCTICKEKPATVHLTQIAGDKMRKHGLCEACAKAKGVNNPLFAPADVMPRLEAATGAKLIPENLDLKLMTVLSAEARKQLRLNAWKLITP
jgi:protein-arginine kinase activator protein McsA